jgi:hypothetical protein
MMQNCVKSAREAGVFKEFHVFTDRPVEDMECYDIHDFSETQGLFKLLYLKAGMTKLMFEYFVWIDADTVFLRSPHQMLESLGKAPIHIPLEVSFSELNTGDHWNGIDAKECVVEMTRLGVNNPIYGNRTAFWVVHREAIDTVCELSMSFLDQVRQSKTLCNVSCALGYAMQMLCGNPRRHLSSECANLWTSDDQNRLKYGVPAAGGWGNGEKLDCMRETIPAAIIHVPHQKQNFESFKGRTPVRDLLQAAHHLTPANEASKLNSSTI